MANNNVLYNILSRILPSGLKARFLQGGRTRWLNRSVSYWTGNSIYLENIYNKIATDVAMMRFKHIKTTRRPGEPDLWDWYEHSDIAEVTGVSPNERDAPLVFWANVIRCMLQSGTAVVVPVYKNRKIEKLELADGAIEYVGDKIIISIDGETQTLNIADVWIFENPKQNLTAQLNSITKLIDDNLRALSAKLNAQQNSTLRGFLKIPTTTGDKEMLEKAQERVNDIMAAAQNGNIGYLQKGEDFKELTNTYSTASTEEMEFLKGQLYQAFGINEKLFTCDYTEEQYRGYYQSVIKVYIRVIREEINRKFFTKTARTQGHKLLVYMDMFDITSLKDLNEFAFKTKYAGILNANEIREIFGYGSYEGGDQYETNLNAVPVSDINNETAKMLQLFTQFMAQQKEQTR